MARGDGGKRIFIGKEDHESLLHWLERVCQSHGWRVHAWVLMGNHFHLLLETPEPNLSAGMRVLLGTYSQAWNSRYHHAVAGFLFDAFRGVEVQQESGGRPFFAGIAGLDEEQPGEETQDHHFLPYARVRGGLYICGMRGCPGWPSGYHGA